jgi:hypothetical protein
LQEPDPADALDVLSGRPAMALGLLLVGVTRPFAIGRSALAAALRAVALVAVAALGGTAVRVTSSRMVAPRMAAIIR